jgi:hypothetical protein
VNILNGIGFLINLLYRHYQSFQQLSFFSSSNSVLLSPLLPQKLSSPFLSNELIQKSQYSFSSVSSLYYNTPLFFFLIKIFILLDNNLLYQNNFENSSQISLYFSIFHLFSLPFISFMEIIQKNKCGNIYFDEEKPIEVNEYRFDNMINVLKIILILFEEKCSVTHHSFLDFKFSCFQCLLLEKSHQMFFHFLLIYVNGLSKRRDKFMCADNTSYDYKLKNNNIDNKSRIIIDNSIPDFILNDPEKFNEYISKKQKEIEEEVLFFFIFIIYCLTFIYFF